VPTSGIPPETNGVIERWYQSIKYEHLYLHEIDDGPALAEHVLDYARLYNETRPHEAIDWAQPLTRYTANPTRPSTPGRPHSQRAN